MLKRFRAWLIKEFLPAWARETMQTENERLRKELEEARTENRRLRDYLDGMETAMRYAKKVTVNFGEMKK